MSWRKCQVSACLRWAAQLRIEFKWVGWAKRSVPITPPVLEASDGHGRGPLPILRLSGFMDYRRYYQAGGTYFFTVVTENREPLLIQNIDRLRVSFHHGMQRYPFVIDGLVVLPDHLHTLWRLPDGDDNFSIRWMVIKRKFSAGLTANFVNTSKQQKREKGIWQRRFWEHCIRDERDWGRHMDYVHYNPVKHGYCAKPADWPYSSFHRAVKEGLYEADWGRRCRNDIRLR
jgi:putative transposase